MNQLNQEHQIEFSGTFKVVEICEQIRQPQIKNNVKRIQGKLKRMINQSNLKLQTFLEKNSKYTQGMIKEPIYQTQTQLTQYKPQFQLVRKRSPEAIQAQMAKFNRRKQFSMKKLKAKAKIQPFIETQIKEDKVRHPQKYVILKQKGLNDQQIYAMPQYDLNYELEKFGKDKGKQYLKQVNYVIRSNSQKHIKRTKTQSNNVEQIQRLKNKNIIHQVFGNLKPKVKQEVPPPQTKPVKPPVYVNQKLQKLNELNSKEEMLGKLVLQKVKKYFKNEKEEGKDYFTMVKSEEGIDDTLIQFLKTKIGRAQCQLKK